MLKIDAMANSRSRSPLRLVLIDHLSIFRENLRQAVRDSAILQVVAEADCGTDVISGVTRLDADIALVDLDLPDYSGFEVCHWLGAHHPRIALVALAYWDWDACLVGTRAVGARGMLLRQASTSELVKSIEQAGSGPIFSPEQMLRLAEWDHNFGGVFRQFRQREWEVFWLASSGLNNREIASRMELTENSVEKLMTAIMSKLHLASRAQLLTLVHTQHLDLLRFASNNHMLTFP